MRVKLDFDEHDVARMLNVWADLRHRAVSAEERLQVVKALDSIQERQELVEARARLEVLQAQLTQQHYAINAQEVLDSLVKPVRALCELIAECGPYSEGTCADVFKGLVKDMATILGEQDRVTW